MTKLLPFLLVTLTLAACAPKTVEDACYKNGDHENLSDGRILRICKCVSSSVADDKFGNKETGWAISIINKDDIKGIFTADQKRLDYVKMIVKNAQRDCNQLK